MNHGENCLSYLCTCPVNEECPVCRPAGKGVLCALHLNQANNFARSMEAVGSPTMDEHEAHLGCC